MRLIGMSQIYRTTCRMTSPSKLRVLNRLETYAQLGAVFQDRSADGAWVPLEQCQRPRFREADFLAVRNVAPRRPAGIGELLPADSLGPFLQLARRHAVLLIVVEFIGDLLRVQGGEGLLHRVAVLDAVDFHFSVFT